MKGDTCKPMSQHVTSALASSSCRRAAVAVIIALGTLLPAVSASGPPRLKPLTDRNPRPLVAVVGDARLRLLCPIEADPPAIATTWRKDGRDIPPGWDRFRQKRDGTLVVSDVEADDGGLYGCRTTNGFGTAEYQILVYVLPDANSTVPSSRQDETNPQETEMGKGRGMGGLNSQGAKTEPTTTPPVGSGVGGPSGNRVNKPRFIPPLLDNMTVNVGSEVILQCYVKSNIEPLIQWLKRVDTPRDAALRQNATLTFNEQRYVVLQIGAIMALANGSYLSKLTLTPRHPLDAGMYICVATNYQGYDYHGAYISVNAAGGNIDDPRYAHPSSSSILPAIVAIIVVTSLVVLCGIAAYYVTRCRASKSSRRDLAASKGSATDGQSHGSGAQESERGGLCCEREQYQILEPPHPASQRYGGDALNSTTTGGGLSGGQQSFTSVTSSGTVRMNSSPNRSKFKVSPEHQMAGGGTKSPQTKVRYDAVQTFGDFPPPAGCGGQPANERYYNGFGGGPLATHQNLINGAATHRSCYCGDV